MRGKALICLCLSEKKCRTVGHTAVKSGQVYIKTVISPNSMWLSITEIQLKKTDQYAAVFFMTQIENVTLNE